METGRKGHPVPARDGDWEVGSHAGVTTPAPLGGGLIQAAHAATGTGSRDNAVPARLRLCSSIRPSMPRMILIPDTVGRHSGVWGPWVQHAHPSGFRIRDNDNCWASSHRRGTLVSGLPGGLCHSPHHPELPTKTIAGGWTSRATFPRSHGCPRRLQAAPWVIRSRQGIRVLLPAVRLARDGWWRLGGTQRRCCVSPRQNVLRSVTG